MNLRDQKVVVLGGAGFIGSHIVEELLKQGLRVCVVDPCIEGTSGSDDNLSAVKNRIEWIHQGVEQIEPLQWRELLSKSRLVIDSMGLTRHHVGIEFPELDLQLNYRSHLAVIRALRACPVSVIYLGSRGQYGKISGRIDEASPMNPVDPQGVHKVAAESMYRIYSEICGFGCISLLLGNCYGPRQPCSGRDLGLVGGFMSKLLAGENVVIYGEESRRRSLIYVEDVARAILFLFHRGIQGFTRINLIGENIALRDLLELLVDELGGGYSFAPFPPEIARIECGEAEISQDRLMSITEGKIAFSDFRASIRSTCTYFKEMVK